MRLVDYFEKEKGLSYLTRLETVKKWAAKHSYEVDLTHELLKILDSETSNIMKALVCKYGMEIVDHLKPALLNSFDNEYERAVLRREDIEGL